MIYYLTSYLVLEIECDNATCKEFENILNQVILQEEEQKEEDEAEGIMTCY